MSRRRKDYSDSVEETHAGGKNKGLAILIVLIIALAGVGAAATYWMMSSPSGGHVSTGTGGGNTGSVPTSPQHKKTHDVIAELFVSTSCPHCVNAEKYLKEIEQEHKGFYFVTFVADMNKEAFERYNETSQRKGVPDVEFDGGYKWKIGDYNFYSDAISYIEDCEYRDVPKIEIRGDAQATNSGIEYELHINTESSSFSGHIRAFVIEKSSKYHNLENEPIPNAFVGYALNEDFSISSSSSYSKTGIWNGDISDPSNMAIVIAVYDSSGHGVQAYRIDL